MLVNPSVLAKQTHYFPEQEAQQALKDNNFSWLYPFIQHIINGLCKRQGIPQDEDVKQMVTIGVWKSLRGYNPSKGRLYTFLTKAVQNHLYWVYSANKQKQERRVKEVSLEAYLEDNGADSL